MYAIIWQRTKNMHKKILQKDGPTCCLRFGSCEKKIMLCLWGRTDLKTYLRCSSASFVSVSCAMGRSAGERGVNTFNVINYSWYHTALSSLFNIFATKLRRKSQLCEILVHLKPPTAQKMLQGKISHMERWCELFSWIPCCALGVERPSAGTRIYWMFLFRGWDCRMGGGINFCHLTCLWLKI